MVPTDVIDDLFASDIVDDPSRSAAHEPVRAERAVRRRRRWAAQATLGAVTLGAIGAFFAISRTIRGEGGTAFDRALVRGAGRARSPAGVLVARGLTFFGGVPGAVGISLATVGAARKRPRLALQIALGALGGVTAELALKRLFRRDRPKLLAHLEDVKSTSFPSGHSMASSSLYLTLAFVASRSRRFRARRRATLSLAGTFASMIGATRVYLGVHWPTDVLAGLALGTAWACVNEAAFDLAAAGSVETTLGREVPG